MVVLAKGRFLREAPNAPPGRWMRYVSLNTMFQLWAERLRRQHPLVQAADRIEGRDLRAFASHQFTCCSVSGGEQAGDRSLAFRVA